MRQGCRRVCSAWLYVMIWSIVHKQSAFNSNSIPFTLTRSGFDTPNTVEAGDSLHHTIILRIVQSGSFDLCTEIRIGISSCRIHQGKPLSYNSQGRDTIFLPPINYRWQNLFTRSMKSWQSRVTLSFLTGGEYRCSVIAPGGGLDARHPTLCSCPRRSCM